MGTNYKVLHKRSGVEGKKPTSADIVLGEIAINFAKDKEFLSILNGNNEIATFSSDKYLDVIIPPIICENISGCTDQVINDETKNSPNPISTKAVYDYVSGHTPTINVDQVIDETTSTSTNAVATKAVYDYVYSKDIIDERDLIVSSALNDLETDKADKAEVDTAIANYTYDKATIDEKVAGGGTFDPSQYYNKTAIDNRLGTGITPSSSVTTAVNSINQNISSNYYTKSGVDTAIANYTYDKATIDEKVASGGSFDPSQYYTKTEINQKELVVSASLNNLEENKASMSDVSNYTYDKATIDEKVAGGGTFDPTQYYNRTAIDNRLGTGITPSSSVTTAINSINQNLSSNYYTKSGVDTVIGDYTYDKATIDEKVASGGSFDPSQYYTKTEINQKELVISASLNSLEENKADISDINSVVSNYTYDKATIDGKDTVLSDELNVLTNFRNFHVGYNSVSTLNRVPTTKRLVLASGITQGNNTLSLSDSFTSGYEMYFIIQGTSGTEINLSPNMINTSGESIIINNNGYCEISVISVHDNGNYTYYVRGI